MLWQKCRSVVSQRCFIKSTFMAAIYSLCAPLGDPLGMISEIGFVEGDILVNPVRLVVRISLETGLIERLEQHILLQKVSQLH